jgi:hypothetical protein
MDSSSLKVGEQIVFLHVDSGDLLIGCQSRTSVGSPTIVDSQLNTWTLSPTASGSSNTNVQMFHAFASASGAVTITFSGVSSARVESVADFKGVSAQDGSYVTAVDNTSPASITANVTTGVIGSLVIACEGMSADNQTASTGQYASYDAEGTQSYITFRNADAAGSYGITYSQYVATGNTRCCLAEVIGAFSPPSLAITDTLLPDADKVQAYTATIHAVGGTGTYACALQSGTLPTGLTLGGTGNCTIAGTVTGAVGNYPITIRVTESGGGTHVDSSSLSIKVGAVFGTSAVVQSHTSITATNVFSSNIVSGHGILVSMYGYARHASPGEGYVVPLGTSGGNVSDSRGTVFQRVLPFIGGDRPNLDFFGCATSSGADTITFTDNQGNGTVVGNVIAEISNVQPTLDFGVITSAQGPNTSPFTFVSNSLNIPVNGVTMFASSATGAYSSSQPTITPVAPATDLGTTFDVDRFDLAATLGVASGGTTQTTTVTSTLANCFGSTHCTNLDNKLLFGIRPGISGLPCGGTPVNASKVIHHSQLF